MALKQCVCPKCSAEKLEPRMINGESGYYCPYCGTEFSEVLGIEEYEKLEATIKSGLGSVIDEALLNERTNKYFNLRSMLWNKITADHADSEAIVAICRDILAIAQHDFLAEFFEIANSSSPAEVAKYISAIDEKKNAMLVDVVLDFIIKSLEEEYITPTALLLDRCGKIFSPEKKQEYLSRFEAEAERVADGLYVTSIERDVFLAYSGKDMPAVIETLKFIEAQGFSCFAAFRNLRHGRDAVANYEKALEDAINHCSIFVLVSSSNSRSFSCDALKREMTYIRNLEMSQHPEYRTYDQVPEKYRKLRIEYRIDNTPTPIAIEKTMKDFFLGLTYAENREQLGIRLSECMEKIYNPNLGIDTPTAQPEVAASTAQPTEEKETQGAQSSKPKTTYDNSFDITGGILLEYLNKAASTVVLPDGVTHISKFAFRGCKNLKSVTIPKSVVEIDDFVFDGLNKELKIYLDPNANVSGFGKGWHGGHALYNSETGKPFKLGGFFKKLFNR